MAISNVMAAHVIRRLHDLIGKIDSASTGWWYTKHKTVESWRNELAAIYNNLLQEHEISAVANRGRTHHCHDQYCYNDEPHVCHKESCDK